MSTPGTARCVPLGPWTKHRLYMAPTATRNASSSAPAALDAMGEREVRGVVRGGDRAAPPRSPRGPRTQQRALGVLQGRGGERAGRLSIHARLGPRRALLEEAHRHACRPGERGGDESVVVVVDAVVVRVVVVVGEDEGPGDVEDDLVGRERAEGDEAAAEAVAGVDERDAGLERGIVRDAREPGEERRRGGGRGVVARRGHRRARGGEGARGAAAPGSARSRTRRRGAHRPW